MSLVNLDSNIIKKGMDHDFWVKQKQRHDNPSFKSKFMTNLLSQQPYQTIPSRTDFNKPIKIDERPNDFMKRSLSQGILHPLPQNPEKTSPNAQLYKSSHTRMSSFGSSSLSKMPVLNNDKEVYSKQRVGRQIDIISQSPHQYRDIIKVFPKYHLETRDMDFWRRKSFIEGMPSQAYNKYSSSRLGDQMNKFKSINRVNKAD